MPSIHIPTLKQRVMKSGSWTILGYGVNQALRLGGNLILTRLLFPEAFGMMAVIQAAIFGITMLTDMGLSQAIIQHRNGNNPEFMNTAWTMQVIRGFIGWLLLSALGIPLSYIYHEPLLAQMLPLIAISALIGGFLSTRQFSAQRNLNLARITLLDISSYSIGLAFTILLAWIQKSVWSLVWGQIITVTLRVAFSHIFLLGEKNHFVWNKEALSHLINFGRWILLSSTMTFLSIEGARLLIGAILDMRQLAMYTLANTLNLMFWQVAQQIIVRVYFPAYSEIHRTRPDHLYSMSIRARITLIAPAWLLSVFFLFMGTSLMDLLYDHRYHESGLMLELLAAGTLAQSIWGSYSNLLLASGKVALESILTATQIALQLCALFIGYHVYGETGLIIGIAASNWIMYPFSAYVMFKNGLWHPKLDIPALAASLLVLLIAWPHLAAKVFVS